MPVCNLISAQLTLVRPNNINALAETVIATDITVLSITVGYSRVAMVTDLYSAISLIIREEHGIQ